MTDNTSASERGADPAILMPMTEAQAGHRIKCSGICYDDGTVLICKTCGETFAMLYVEFIRERKTHTSNVH